MTKEENLRGFLLKAIQSGKLITSKLPPSELKVIVESGKWINGDLVTEEEMNMLDECIASSEPLKQNTAESPEKAPGARGPLNDRELQDCIEAADQNHADKRWHPLSLEMRLWRAYQYLLGRVEEFEDPLATFLNLEAQREEQSLYEATNQILEEMLRWKVGSKEPPSTKDWTNVMVIVREFDEQKKRYTYSTISAYGAVLLRGWSFGRIEWRYVELPEETSKPVEQESDKDRR